ncbi:MAG: preprotein translocase subunit SecA [candidate division KSB1 bacterium]|nr:preprotein translocase subunit SecA [candidate division KSB1 bacterium]MDZ7391354.1 preprotein translocase subunit SecA [candidate division KSB1 bacterium]MDZ7413844.1 preprotein translocase subunit SecA [candidate division KSB1 bacterium]
MANLLTKLFGDKHTRDVARIMPIVHKINAIYETLHELSDAELRQKTEQFRARIQEATREVRAKLEERRALLTTDAVEGEEAVLKVDAAALREEIAALEKEEDQIIGRVLDEILPEAYAVVKETCRRLVGKTWKVCDHDITWDMVPFDVQLIGAVVLHQGKIAEMATGEGKTLVATMPLYLNALAGKGVHLVTVNDYLARRDCEWMGEIYKFLGLTVDYIASDMDPERRRRAYNCDITYGTNNEFGFDYLRDNMAIRREDQVQRGHYYAIVDEVDSVLIDEARTPLIISGAVEHTTNLFAELKPRVEQLVKSQTLLVNRLVAEAEQLLEKGQEYEAGIKLLQALRGAPKNKRLAKIMQEVGVKRLIQKVEADYLRDKRMHEIDEELYFSIDEKSHVIDLTEKGREALSPNDPEMFVLPDLAEGIGQIDNDPTLSPEEKEERKARLHEEYGIRSERIQNISQLLRAYSLFERDVEYVVSEDGRVIIVDEFTGRLMPGRRYSDGLHQAIEAKEGVRIERETQTLATITLQNFFRLYRKLAGMTGTAVTEAAEFWEIYKLDVVVIPTNEPVRRIDYDDRIYRTKREKYNAVIEEIAAMHAARRPVLVGTVSVEVSETLSRMLKRRGIPHNVLNAKHHQREAEIVARAGQPGAVTIATNMAGRGTDIKLGAGVVKHPNCALVRPDPGSEPCPYLEEYDCYNEVPCGLHILGTERHEARRIDRQLRGRAGRQGDPGSSRFYLSLEDDLMRLFGSERIASIMDRLGVQEGEVITHPMVSRSIERAQKRVEEHNFDIRKHLLEYDDVMNQQREVVYNRRNYALSGQNLREDVLEMMEEVIEDRVDEHTSAGPYPEDWNWTGLNQDLRRIMLTTISREEFDSDRITREELIDKIRSKAMALYEAKEKALGGALMRQLERFAILRAIDEQWRDHLYSMDVMKEGIGLRAYGQKDPLIEYKSEAFKMFSEMLARTNEAVLEMVFKAQLQVAPQPVRRMPVQVSATHASTTGLGLRGAPVGEGAPEPGKRQPIRVGVKVGRNDPCPCGSGKKYKKCCGAGVH